MPKDNKLLLEGLRNGHEKAYKTLYALYYESLVRYCFSLTMNLHQAEDIVQNVLIKIWHNRENIIITTSLKSYLHRAVFNGFVKEFDKKKRKEQMFFQIKREVLDMVLELDNESELLDKKMKLLNMAIEELPPKCKEVFLLNKKQGYKYKEIATQLSISEKAVEKHISRALRRIKKTVYASAPQIFLLLYRKIFMARIRLNQLN